MSATGRPCPSCGTEDAGARFCRVCGQVLAKGPVTVDTLPPAAPAEVPPEARTDPPVAPLSPSTRPDPQARHAARGDAPGARRIEAGAEGHADPAGARGRDRSGAAFAVTMSTEPPRDASPDGRPTRAAPDSGLQVSEGQILGSLPGDATAALLGTTLGGRYHVDTLIGEGGFGAVFGGTHLTLGERVAIKLLHAEWAVQPEFRARFVREAVALSRLRHPGIVTVLDFGEDGGRPYLVMELVYGRPLSRLILDGPDALSPARIVGLFDQILEAVEVAHAAGVVHRDIKPDNVLLVPDRSREGVPGGADRVKLLDFGIALVDDQQGGGRLTATNAVQGTPAYMSPEQCRGRDVGPATDVYAVGAMLYEALAGAPPFSGDTSTDLMVKHMFMVPPPVRERGWKREAPPELEALTHWALAKRPEERPSAAELRGVLLRVGEGSDPVSRAARAAEGRVVEGARSREERGLPSPPHSQVETVVRLRDVSEFAGQGPQIIMWGMDRDRAELLRAALAVNGLLGISWVEEDPPPPTVGGQAVKAVVVAGASPGEAMARALRASGRSGKLPLLVVDVAAPESIAALIRAGASDVALAAVGDEEVCRKAWRLVQRGR